MDIRAIHSSPCCDQHRRQQARVAHVMQRGAAGGVCAEAGGTGFQQGRRDLEVPTLHCLQQRQVAAGCRLVCVNTSTDECGDGFRALQAYCQYQRRLASWPEEVGVDILAIDVPFFRSVHSALSTPPRIIVGHEHCRGLSQVVLLQRHEQVALLRRQRGTRGGGRITTSSTRAAAAAAAAAGVGAVIIEKGRRPTTVGAVPGSRMAGGTWRAAVTPVEVSCAGTTRGSLPTQLCTW